MPSGTFADLATDSDYWSTTDPLLEYSPEMAYFSAAPFQGASPFEQQYWSNQYGDTYNQYQGALGRSMRAGDPVSSQPTWVGFLDAMPWTERYTALGPRMRPGGSTQRYAPATRWAF